MYNIFNNFNFIYINKVGSTNEYVSKLLNYSNPTEGSVFIAHEQFAGKGQMNNKWESEPYKNLTVSVVLYPNFLNIENQFWLTKILSLSVISAVNNIVGKSKLFKIKWPNDIYYSNKKIAGILVKNNIQHNNIINSVVGLGLNVNQKTFSANLPFAYSLTNINGKVYNLNNILNEWHKQLDYWYFMLKNGQFNKINKIYLENLYLKNKYAQYIIDNKTVEAKIINVEKYGLLKLKDKNDNVFLCNMKEVKFINE